MSEGFAVLKPATGALTVVTVLPPLKIKTPAVAKAFARPVMLVEGAPIFPSPPELGVKNYCSANIPATVVTSLMMTDGLVDSTVLHSPSGSNMAETLLVVPASG